MTDEEMAEDYAETNWEWYEDGQRDYIAIKQAFLAGLKAGKDMGEHCISETRCDMCDMEDKNE